MPDTFPLLSLAKTNLSSLRPAGFPRQSTSALYLALKSQPDWKIKNFCIAATLGLPPAGS